MTTSTGLQSHLNQVTTVKLISFTKKLTSTSLATQLGKFICNYFSENTILFSVKKDAGSIEISNDDPVATHEKIIG